VGGIKAITDDDAMDLVSDTTKENQSHKAPNVNPLKRHKGISHDGIMNVNKMDFSALMDDDEGGRDGRRIIRRMRTTRIAFFWVLTPFQGRPLLMLP
jgi:hypothetical protein